MTEQEDRAAYGARHRRVYSQRGKAVTHDCVGCADDGVTKRADEWAQVNTEDGEDPWADYVPLCRKCHVHYDALAGRKPGRKRKLPGAPKGPYHGRVTRRR